MRVKEIMTRTVCTCGPEDTAATAAQVMWDHDCGIVPIVAEDGRLLGVVTDRDLCMAALLQNRRLGEIALATFMAHDLCTCHSDDLILQVEYLLGKWRLHRLPVVDDDGVLVGMISLADMARHVPAKAQRLRDPEREELIEALRAISEPRMGGEMTQH